MFPCTDGFLSLIQTPRKILHQLRPGGTHKHFGNCGQRGEGMQRLESVIPRKFISRGRCTRRDGGIVENYENYSAKCHTGILNSRIPGNAR